MGKWIRRIAMALLLAVFLFSAGTVLVIRHQYAVSDRRYEAAAAQFTEEMEKTLPSGGEEAAPEAETAPLTVDFDALKAVNTDVIGWIYCEGTPINYPVVQGENDDQYLTRSYDGTVSAAGSIFAEALNNRDFADQNTILYGHHMKNDSMFAALEHWAEPGFYEAHPVLWLLTPQQDYKVCVYSGYMTSALSDAFTIFTGPCRELDDYLGAAVERSDFQSGVTPDGTAKHVLLSTCSYVFDNARYVLHGMLIPVESAGGAPFDAPPVQNI